MYQKYFKIKFYNFFGINEYNCRIRVTMLLQDKQNVTAHFKWCRVN